MAILQQSTGNLGVYTMKSEVQSVLHTQKQYTGMKCTDTRTTLLCWRHALLYNNGLLTINVLMYCMKYLLPPSGNK